MKTQTSGISIYRGILYQVSHRVKIFMEVLTMSVAKILYVLNNTSHYLQYNP